MVQIIPQAQRKGPVCKTVQHSCLLLHTNVIYEATKDDVSFGKTPLSIGVIDDDPPKKIFLVPD